MSDRLRYINVRLWQGKSWPEQADSVTASQLAGRDNIGVAFSGGGTRSASATLGQLRALHAMGWLDKIRYIAAVSGGAWTAVPFTFLPKRRSDKTFLGPMVDAAAITLQDLDNLDIWSFAHVISQSSLFESLLRNGLAGDELYSRAIGEVFLAPLGISPSERLFTANESTLQTLLDRNPDLRETDFELARADRPFLVVTGTVLRPKNPNKDLQRFRFDMTPLYVGVREFFENAGSNRRAIGGGFIESAGFDSDSPEGDAVAGRVTVRLGSRHRFTLSDVVGTTGAAPAGELARRGIDSVGFPEFKYWSPASSPFPEDKDYEFGDGGDLENLGIMPLLARGVKRLIVFVNTLDALVVNNPCKVTESLRAVFGTTNDGFVLNQVFKPERFVPLIQSLWKRLADGGPAWHRETYDVLENQHHGVEGGWRADVTWVYNQMPGDWYDALLPEVRNLIGKGELANFPHYKTFSQNKKFIDLSARQVSLLAHMTSWATVESLRSSERQSARPGRRKRSRKPGVRTTTRVRRRS